LATAASPDLSFRDQNQFLLRKLHSLSGIVPVGAFLIEHLLTNSRAFEWFGLFGGGREAFNEDVHWIHNLPFLLVLETLFIFLPLAFHAGYGVLIALTAEPNQRLYPYWANWRYSLMRASGWIALIFIIVHLFKFRFAHLIGWSDVAFIGHPDPYELTRIGMQEWKVWDWFTVDRKITFGFYILGLWAAVFHFCNGIWSFCISWGITVGAKAQKRVGYVATAIAVVLLTWGHASLYAFYQAKPSGHAMSENGPAAPETQHQK